MNQKFDIVIVGTGVAGLFCALGLPRDRQILMLSKDRVDRSDSFLAQGGICVLKDEADFDSFFEDTMRAGHYENNPASVETMIRSSPATIRELERYGVQFAKRHGDHLYTREGGHSKPRILFHEDITGKEITSKLLAQVKSLPNVRILEHTAMVDLLIDGKSPLPHLSRGSSLSGGDSAMRQTGINCLRVGKSGSASPCCRGVIARLPDGTLCTIGADYTVLACGGLGGLYQHSTNYRHLTGDALAIALRHGIALEHIDYIQIHPTTLYSESSGRRFLISESVRGEGAVLLDKSGRRFANELLPRDLLTAEIRRQMEIDGTPHVHLSLLPIGREKILTHFPNIYRRCLEEGYDVTREPIPVVPAQHYFMGGIRADLEGHTSMPRLYAVGETSCTGVHGANRLASNSLLESLVFARRAALDIAAHYRKQSLPLPTVDYTAYQNKEVLAATYRTLVLNEIEKEKASHESYHNEIKRRPVSSAGSL